MSQLPSFASPSQLQLQPACQRRARRVKALQPWTAARCHRLLRQLESRLASLRRLKEDHGVSSWRTKRDSLDQEPHRPSKRVRYTYGKKRQTEGSASELSPPTTPPPVIRTRRAMNIAHSSPMTGHVEFTPSVWRRIKEQPKTPQARDSFAYDTTGGCSKLSPELQEEVRSLRKSFPGEQSRIYEAIFSWFATLLQITTQSTELKKQQVHPKSLIGMCLRKIPACVDNIVTYERQLSIETGEESMWRSSNVSFELYGQLEAFGPEGQGWPPLKLVLRSQTMSLLSDAISDRLFEPVFVGLLVRVCSHFDCASEASKLVSSMQDAFPEPRSSRSSLAESSHLQPLRSIVDYKVLNRIPGPVFDCASALVTNDLLSIKWLSTRAFSHLWAASLEAIASKRPAPSVSNFITMALFRLSQVADSDSISSKSDATQTLISMLGGIVATSIALESDIKSKRQVYRLRAWRRLLYVLESCRFQVQQNTHPSTGHKTGLLLLSLARYIATAGSYQASEGLQQQAATELRRLFARNDNDSHLRHHQMILLICCIARCRGRACTGPGYDALAEICTKFDALKLPQWFGDGLRTDVAFFLAQKTKDLRDLAYAESLPARMGSARAGTLFSGWHWDEGISEWVLSDPKANSVQSQQIRVLDRRLGGTKSEERSNGCHLDQRSRIRSRNPAMSSDPGVKRVKRVVEMKELPGLSNRGRVMQDDDLGLHHNLIKPKRSENICRFKVRHSSIMLADNDWDELV